MSHDDTGVDVQVDLQVLRFRGSVVPSNEASCGHDVPLILTRDSESPVTSRAVAQDDDVEGSTQFLQTDVLTDDHVSQEGDARRGGCFGEGVDNILPLNQRQRG